MFRVFGGGGIKEIEGKEKRLEEGGLRYIVARDLSEEVIDGGQVGHCLSVHVGKDLVKAFCGKCSKVPQTLLSALLFAQQIPERLVPHQLGLRVNF